MGRENNQPKQKTKEEKMALSINTFPPFSMRSAFDNSFFSNRWNDDWMVPSRNLDNQFKEFRSLFNEEEAKVEEDNNRMVGSSRHTRVCLIFHRQKKFGCLGYL